MLLFAGQVVGQCGCGAGAVAHGVLGVVAQLRESLVEALGREHGVVAEAFGSAAFRGYLAFYDSFEKMFGAFLY